MYEFGLIKTRSIFSNKLLIIKFYLACDILVQFYLVQQIFIEAHPSDIMKFFRNIYIYHTSYNAFTLFEHERHSFFLSTFPTLPRDLSHFLAKKHIQNIAFKWSIEIRQQLKACFSSFPCTSQVPSSSYCFPAMFCLSGLQHYSRLNNQQPAFSLQKCSQIYQIGYV